MGLGTALTSPLRHVPRIVSCFSVVLVRLCGSRTTAAPSAKFIFLLCAVCRASSIEPWSALRLARFGRRSVVFARATPRGQELEQEVGRRIGEHEHAGIAFALGV